MKYIVNMNALYAVNVNHVILDGKDLKAGKVFMQAFSAGFILCTCTCWHLFLT